MLPRPTCHACLVRIIFRVSNVGSRVTTLPVDSPTLWTTMHTAYLEVAEEGFCAFVCGRRGPRTGNACMAGRNQRTWFVTRQNGPAPWCERQCLV